MKKCEEKPHHLQPVLLDFLLPIFQRLSEPALLQRCLPGYSQNQNDSLNSLVWLRAPKHKHRGARSTEIAVILAMLQYNKGASAKFGVMKRLYPPGSFSSAGSAQKDRERVQFARRAEDDEVKARREKRRQGKRKLEESWLEGTSYESGALNELDVLQTSQKERSRRKKTTARKKDAL